MDSIKVDNILIEYNNLDVTFEELEQYLLHVKAKHKNKSINKIVLRFVGEDVEIETHFKKVPFSRIRRITGYLVGSTENWNNAKQAELHDRVKHGK